jgi:protein TonB
MDGMPVFHYKAVWDQIRQQPMTRMLLLSLSLHAAVVMLVQPRSSPVLRDNVVINARLVAANPVPSPQPASVQVEPVIQLPPVPKQPEPVKLALSPQLAPPPVAAPPDNARPQPAADTKPAATTPDPKDVAARPATSTSPSLPSVPVMVDTHWYEARQLDVQPKASQPINPLYPPEAQRRNQQGTVKLKLKVDEFGVVQDVEVEEGNPPGVFDDSALAAFKQAHFEPARKDGQPVRALIYIRVRYELDGF